MLDVLRMIDENFEATQEELHEEAGMHLSSSDLQNWEEVREAIAAAEAQGITGFREDNNARAALLLAR